MKKWARIIIGLVALIIVLGLAVFFALRPMGEGMAIMPLEERAPLVHTCADYNMPCEEVMVTTADGLDLVGWYLPSQNGAALLVQHGFGGDRQDVMWEASLFHRNGYGVLMTTFRGHDKNVSDTFTWSKNESQDLDAFYQYLLTRDDVDPERIGIYGESMGGAMGIKYTSENPKIKAIIVHAALPSVNDAVEVGMKTKTGLPPFPFAPMLVYWAEKAGDFKADDLDAAAWIKEMCGVPILLLQGGLDDHIPADSGQKLYDAACEPKELWYEEESVHHGHDVPEVVPPAVYEGRLVEWFDRFLLD
jgi:esterase/lipase